MSTTTFAQRLAATSLARANNLSDVNSASATNINQGVFTVPFNGGGGVVVANTASFLAYAPFAGTITGWRILGQTTTGSCVIDWLRWNGAAYVSIIGAGNKPTLSSAQRASASVSGWTSVTVSVGDEFKWNLDSCVTLTNIVVEFLYTKS